jgi:hypothetical protein
MAGFASRPNNLPQHPQWWQGRWATAVSHSKVWTGSALQEIEELVEVESEGRGMADCGFEHDPVSLS